MPVCVPVFVRYQLHTSAFHGFEGIFGECVHFQEPLHRKTRFDNGIRPFGITYRGCVILHLFQVSGFTEHAFYLVAGIESVLAYKNLRFLVQTAVVINDVEHGEIVPESYFVVIHVMCRSHFKASGTESHFDITVLNNRYLFVYKRDKHLLSPEPVIPFVFRIDADCRIGHYGLRTCGRDDYVFVGRIPVSV